MPTGEFDKFIEVGMLRPEQSNRSRYTQVQYRDLLDRRYLEMGGNKGQTYPDGDESKCPVILVV
jgi:hypothetical protein